MAVSTSDVAAMYSLLSNSMNTDHRLRGPAKEALAQSESKPGFCSYLLETLQVKDEEIQNFARDLRTQDSTIRDIAEKLSGTTETAEATAEAAYTWRNACEEIERLKKDSEKQLELSAQKLREYVEKIVSLRKEKERLSKQRGDATQEANMWRSELAKARESGVILEGVVARA